MVNTHRIQTPQEFRKANPGKEYPWWDLVLKAEEIPNHPELNPWIEYLVEPIKEHKRATKHLPAHESKKNSFKSIHIFHYLPEKDEPGIEWFKQFTPPGRLLNDARKEAKMIIEAAKKEAQTIIKAARKEAEALILCWATFRRKSTITMENRKRLNE
jgi:cell division septum initiation protein DivIVA